MCWNRKAESQGGLYNILGNAFNNFFPVLFLKTQCSAEIFFLNNLYYSEKKLLNTFFTIKNDKQV